MAGPVPIGAPGRALARRGRNAAPDAGAGRFAGYIALVTGAGLVGALALLLRAPRGHLLDPAVAVAIAFVVLGELRPLVTPARWDVYGVPVSTAFLFALLLFNGPWLVSLLVVVSTAASDIGRHRARWRTAFNIGQYELSWLAAAAVLAGCGDLGHPGQPVRVDGFDLLPLLAAACAYFLVNAVLVGGAVSLHDRVPLVTVVRRDLGYQALTSFSLLFLAPLVLVLMERSAWLLLLLLLPLTAVYLTAAVSQDRDRQALHDALTGLPNRVALRFAMEAAFEAARTGGGGALLLLDLDEFKEVNDTLGHHVGDQMLQRVAGRILRAVPEAATVARLGGDEFAVLLPQVTSAADAGLVAQQLVDTLGRPFDHDGLALDLGASIGVALFPADAGDIEGLLRHADVAMYQAKAVHGGVRHYDPRSDHHTCDRLGLLADLRRALDDRTVQPYFQPKACTATGVVSGVEALLRWRHPERGFIEPDEFVPLAEQYGLIPRLTRVVLDVALGQLAVWQRRGMDLEMAVNVSPLDLLDPGFTPFVREVLARHGVAGSRLVLEVTERVLAQDLQLGSTTTIAAALGDLHRLGVGLSLDDFGTGYSSLGRLDTLPVTEIKIDRSFVSRLDRAADAPIVRSIIDLGHALGLTVVAEGVETAQAWRTLAEYGCDSVQGFLLARAMPADDATAWLASHDGRPAVRGLRLRTG